LCESVAGKRLPVEIHAVKRFSYVPLEMTVRNNVPSKNILAGTLFLTVISRGT
jgi:hypothetical protein